VELTNDSRRWEDDERGRGIADAVAFAPGATELVEAMRTDCWVAEDPDVHLRPHLERACHALPLELRGTGLSPDGTYDVDLVWRGDGDGVGAIRAAVFALAGSVAEPASYVRQRRDDGALLFELVTGMVGEDSHFSPHGHAVRFRVDRAEQAT
jgi:hypothetical protein